MGDEGREGISGQVQKLIRMQAWKNYQAALLSYVAHWQKLQDIASVLAISSPRLLVNPKYNSGADLSVYVYPTFQDVCHEMEDFKTASEHLERCKRASLDSQLKPEIP
jgi:hypothetical protein